MSFKDIKVITFDFDGVLVDSYTVIPKIYKEIGEIFLGIGGAKLDRFVKDMLQGEELLDLGFLGPRREWWPIIMSRYVNGKPIDLDKVDEFYWKERIKGSFIIEGVVETLELLGDNGFSLYIMCSRDDKDGSKMNRIVVSGIDKYFKDIFLIGENVSSRAEAIEAIKTKEGVDVKKILVVDDKVPPLYEARRLGVWIAKVDFEGPIKLAWNLPLRPHFRVKRIKELVGAILEIKKN